MGVRGKDWVGLKNGRLCDGQVQWGGFRYWKRVGGSKSAIDGFHISVETEALIS